MLAIDGTWAAAIITLQVAIAGLLLLTERRITRIETDVRWLKGRRRTDREVKHDGTSTD